MKTTIKIPLNFQKLHKGTLPLAHRCEPFSLPLTFGSSAAARWEAAAEESFLPVCIFYTFILSVTFLGSTIKFTVWRHASRGVTNKSVTRRDLQMCLMGRINRLVRSPVCSGVWQVLSSLSVQARSSLLRLLTSEAPGVSRFIFALATSPQTSRKMRNVSRDLWPLTDMTLSASLPTPPSGRTFHVV